MKKLYYTCLIKALYMIKEFGINCDLDNLKTTKRSNGELIPLSKLMTLEKIYVAKESEHIFQPKIDDIGITASGDTCHFDGEQWLIDAGKRFIKAEHADIIFREKQFFMPEVENN